MYSCLYYPVLIHKLRPESFSPVTVWNRNVAQVDSSLGFGTDHLFYNLKCRFCTELKSFYCTMTEEFVLIFFRCKPKSGGRHEEEVPLTTRTRMYNSTPLVTDVFSCSDSQLKSSNCGSTPTALSFRRNFINYPSSINVILLLIDQCSG